jgi:hypothetical protein
MRSVRRAAERGSVLPVVVAVQQHDDDNEHNGEDARDEDHAPRLQHRPRVSAGGEAVGSSADRPTGQPMAER